MVGHTERDPPFHQGLGQIEGRHRRVRRRRVEVGITYEGGHGLQRAGQRVIDGEHGCLVLLEVPVVGHRQAFLESHQACQLPDGRSRLAAGQLRYVGVLLVRHGGRTGGQRIAERRPAELGACPQHALLGQSRQVHQGLGADKGVFGNVVPGGHRVHRVDEPAPHPQQIGGAVRVDREAATSERAGTERGNPETLPNLPETLDIP